MLRIPHCLHSRLTNGSEVVGLTHRPRSTPRINLVISVSGTQFCQRLSKLQGLLRLEGLGKLKKFSDHFGCGTRDLPACSVVCEPLRHGVPPFPGVTPRKRVICRCMQLQAGWWMSGRIRMSLHGRSCHS
jgi:hypothetical protein